MRLFAYFIPVLHILLTLQSTETKSLSNAVSTASHQCDPPDSQTAKAAQAVPAQLDATSTTPTPLQYAKPYPSESIR